MQQQHIISESQTRHDRNSNNFWQSQNAAEMVSNIEYSEVPPRAQKIMDEDFKPDQAAIAKRVEHFSYVQPRDSDKDGDVERLDDVDFTHHFVKTPGDYDKIEWHYVTCGNPNNTAIVFLHGIPDSWFSFHHQMASLSSTHFCVGVDLKGYGQSSKVPGAYQHEEVAEQLFVLLQTILPAPKKCIFVTHDRGTVQADFIAAKYPQFVLGYARGEQHLYHFNPALAPQGEIFLQAPYTGVMEDPKKFVLFVYTWITEHAISDAEMERTIQEFSYEGINRAAPRYFASSTFRQEWLARREGGWRLRDGSLSKEGLLKAWKCPVLIMEGYGSKTQPREFYEKAREYIPNAAAVEVVYLSGGHFWPLESPEETTRAVRRLIEMVGRS